MISPYFNEQTRMQISTDAAAGYVQSLQLSTQGTSTSKCHKNCFPSKQLLQPTPPTLTRLLQPIVSTSLSKHSAKVGIEFCGRILMFIFLESEQSHLEAFVSVNP